MKKKDQTLLLILGAGVAAYFLFKGSSQATAQRSALQNKVLAESGGAQIWPVFTQMSDSEINAMYKLLILQQPQTPETVAIIAKYNLQGT